MYITSFRQLFDVIEQRQAQQEAIGKKVNAFALQHAQVENFLTHAQYLFPHEKGVQGILARQIPSITIEDVGFFLGARAWGIHPVAWSLVGDKHSNDNKEKRSRVLMRWIHERPDGTLYPQGEKIADRNNINGVVLADIQTECGSTLPEYHQQLREGLWNGNYPVRDSSVLWKKLAQSEYLPPSHWFYPLYLSLFCDGRAVLFETYDNPTSNISSIQKVFERTMQMLEHEIGVSPLIVKIPHQTADLLSCRSNHLINKQTSWLMQRDDTCEHFEEIHSVLLGEKQ